MGQVWRNILLYIYPLFGIFIYKQNADQLTSWEMGAKFCILFAPREFMGPGEGSSLLTLPPPTGYCYIILNIIHVTVMCAIFNALRFEIVT